MKLYEIKCISGRKSILEWTGRYITVERGDTVITDKPQEYFNIGGVEVNYIGEVKNSRDKQLVKTLYERFLKRRERASEITDIKPKRTRKRKND